jgi:hypothetical protein
VIVIELPTGEAGRGEVWRLQADPLFGRRDGDEAALAVPEEAEGHFYSRKAPKLALARPVVAPDRVGGF